MFTSYICKAKCSDNEPKDRSDTRSVVFDEVESSDQWIGKINPIACLQATFCKAKCSDYNKQKSNQKLNKASGCFCYS